MKQDKVVAEELVAQEAIQLERSKSKFPLSSGLIQSSPLLVSVLCHNALHLQSHIFQSYVLVVHEA